MSSLWAAVEEWSDTAFSDVWKMQTVSLQTLCNVQVNTRLSGDHMLAFSNQNKHLCKVYFWTVKYNINIEINCLVSVCIDVGI